MTCASPPSAILTRRCLRSPRTQPTDHSSQKSSLPSRMSSSQTPAATWYLGRRSFCHRESSSLSDVFRDYLSVKVWDLHMESKPIETFTVHEYLRSKLCSLYENDCIFDKFEVGRLINHNSGRLNDCKSKFWQCHGWRILLQCCWNGTDSAIMTGSYNNFFR